MIIGESRKVFTDKDYDVTFIEIKPEKDRINEFLDLDEDFDSEQYKEIFKENEDIDILQWENLKTWPNAACAWPRPGQASLAWLKNFIKNKIK